MNEKEFKWLTAVMQNPIIHGTNEMGEQMEPEDEKLMRNTLWDLLNEH